MQGLDRKKAKQHKEKCVNTGEKVKEIRKRRNCKIVTLPDPQFTKIGKRIIITIFVLILLLLNLAELKFYYFHYLGIFELYV